MVTAFFGVGAGLEAVGDWDLLRQMYRQWPLFHAVVHNAELALVKADLDIARRYALLLDNPADGERLWRVIRDEYERAKAALLRVVEQDELLAGAGWLQRSVQARNPYVDVLNFAQVELLGRRAKLLNQSRPNGELDAVEQQLRLSVQGIAAGLRNTG